LINVCQRIHFSTPYCTTMDTSNGSCWFVPSSFASTRCKNNASRLPRPSFSVHTYSLLFVTEQNSLLQASVVCLLIAVVVQRHQNNNPSSFQCVLWHKFAHAPADCMPMLLNFVGIKLRCRPSNLNGTLLTLSCSYSSRQPKECPPISICKIWCK